MESVLGLEYSCSYQLFILKGWYSILLPIFAFECIEFNIARQRCVVGNLQVKSELGSNGNL